MEKDSHLERQVVPFTKYTRQLDDSLHTLYLAFDDFVEVLFLDLGETQEVDGSRITS